MTKPKPPTIGPPWRAVRQVEPAGRVYKAILDCGHTTHIKERHYRYSRCRICPPEMTTGTPPNSGPRKIDRQERRDRIRQLLDTGLNCDAIATELGLTRKHLMNVLYAEDIELARRVAATHPRSLGPRVRPSDRIEDVEWLLECDTPVWQVAARCGGLKPESLAVWLRNNGRPDLARTFDAARDSRGREVA